MTIAILIKFLAAIVAGYLIGSIPFGVLVGKRLAKVDPRSFGSGKMGTTNVLRVAGKKVAALVLILDMFKGAGAVVLAWLLLRGDYHAEIGTLTWYMLRSASALAALAAIAGHIWPVFLKFKGGRGVATFYGGMFALCPPVAFLSGQVFLLGASATRLVSLASIAGAIATYLILIPLTIFSGFPWENLLYGLVGSLALIMTHRDNIVRLMNGKERKLGDQAETAAPVPALPSSPELRHSRTPVRVGLIQLKLSRQNLHR
jgi:acyl phosphate:glycerol-3-phosphate acyltransferase